MVLDGDDYEARSERLLRDYGLTILARRYRCRAGEIDLIARDEHRLLFIEVRARAHRSHGGAAASVNHAKQCRLTRCAAHYLSRHPQLRHLPCRFDVIAWEPGRRAERGPAPSAGAAGAAKGSPRLQARWIQAAFLA